MSLDPATTVTTTTATSSRPNSPFPNPNTKPLHHYASNSQQQTLSVRSPNPPFLYRFGSPSRATANHSVGGYPPPPQQPQPPLLYSHGGVRGGMNLDYLSQALPVTRPLSHVQFPHLAAAATSSPTVKGHLKVGRSTVSDVNGHKDSSARERSRDDTLTVVRDRKRKPMFVREWRLLDARDGPRKVAEDERLRTKSDEEFFYPQVTSSLLSHAIQLSCHWCHWFHENYDFFSLLEKQSYPTMPYTTGYQNSAKPWHHSAAMVAI
ncbi:hypothetical protein L195_g010354 [Trifolium pratense]|uniref:Uncharacterized protein n=1 Tax=Trifolium pratense TaxID=57577 RepID=A0A2K3PEG8_TRIPR|nr:hypothetical protein L195_g010354 [Trifolium pratense]